MDNQQIEVELLKQAQGGDMDAFADLHESTWGNSSTQSGINFDFNLSRWTLTGQLRVLAITLLDWRNADSG